MNINIVKKAIASLLSLLILITCFPIITMGSTANAATSNVSVSVDKSVVSIKIENVGTSGEALVYSCDANEYFETDNMTGLSKLVNQNGNIIDKYNCGTTKTITINRYYNDGTDNLYRKYYIIKDNEILAGPFYADKIDSLKTVPAFEKKTKKGLHLEDQTTINEAEKLGISNTVINMDLGSLIIDKSVASQHNCIEFESNGETYYFDANYIRAQDGLISAYTKKNINVSLVLITWASAETNGKYPKDLFYVTGNRQTAGFNTSNEKGLKYYIATMEFLSKRYSQPEKYGQVNKYIVGNEIDYTYDWYLMQPNYKNGLVQRMDFDKFMEEYSRTLRITNLAIKKYNSESKAIISLTHNWAESCLTSYGYASTNQNTLRYNSYAPKDILDWMSKYEKARGDYDWGICGHPYPIGTTPSNPLKTDLDPPGAAKPITGDYKTSPWITVANLELYQQYFEVAKNKYNGELREVSVIEGGICNPAKESVSASNYKIEVEQQAGTIAQFYYRAALLDCVTEVAYFRIHDLPSTSLRLGLKEADGTLKPSYNVWKYVDTNKSFNYANKYLHRVDWTGNADSYKDIMDRVKSGFDWNAAWDESKIMCRTLPVDTTVASLKTDKTSYSANEPVNVTATGSEGSYVGLYLKSDDYTTADPILSYPVSGEENNVTFVSGRTYDITAFGQISDTRYNDAYLKAGNYVIAMQDALSGDYITKNITITSDYSYGKTNYSLSTSKTTYSKGEGVVVSATGNSNCWVGIYKSDDVYGTGATTSIFWYYINDKDSRHISGKPTVIQSTIHNSDSSNPGTVLMPGEYTIYLFDGSNGNDYYEVAKTNVTVEPSASAQLESVDYKLDNETDGFANGTVTVTKNPDDIDATDCALYWGDENGNMLEGYTNITRFKLESATTSVELPTHLVIPNGAKKLLAYAFDGTSVLGEAVSVNLPENCQYDLSTDDMIMEFQMISDTHVTTDDGASGEVKLSNVHFKQFLEDVRDNSPESKGIFISGDVVNTGIKAEYDKVLNIYNSVKKTTSSNFPELHMAIGNHDWLKGNPSSQFQLYAKFFNSNLEKQPEKVYYTEVVGGYQFVYLGSETSGLRATISDEQLEWFDNLMKKCTEENPDKPVFVMLHQSFYSTVAGSLPGQGWDGVNNEHKLKRVMENYGQIVLFNGHSHWEFDSENNMFAGDEESPVAFNTASVGYLWTSYNTIGGEFQNGSQAYYVRVYDDKIVVLGRDVENGKFVASSLYVVQKTRLDIAKTDYVISKGQNIEIIDVDADENAFIDFKSLDTEIVSVSDEGALIPKSVGETQIVVSVAGTDTKVMTKKTINVKVVESSNNWTEWVHDSSTKTHSRTNIDTGVVETKSCRAQTTSDILSVATFKTNGKKDVYCSVCKAFVETVTIPKIKTVKLSNTSYVYDGKVKKPSVSVVASDGSLLDSSNYSVSYSSGTKAVGKHKVTVKFRNEYSGNKTVNFKINPKPTTISKLTSAKNGFKVTWKKGNKNWTAKYQIRYSTSSKFKKAKTITVKGYKSSSKTVSKLLSKKKYYVQIRIVKNGCYSAWSKKKSVKTK